ncbi:hypothetical protein [Arcticibacter tournemirensis]
MKETVCKYTLLIIFCMGSCEKDNSQLINKRPDPEPPVIFQCPKDGDIYKLIVDTIIFNRKGELYITNGHQITFEYATIPLGVCAKTADFYGTARYSPMAAIVKTDEGKTREMIWDRNGYIKNMILPEDIERFLTFTDGKKISFELSLLNFNHDIIQTSSMTIIYRERFPDK